MGTPNCVTQSMQKIQIPLHVLLSEKCATITAHPSHNNFTGSRFPNGSNANLNAFVTITLSLVLPPLISPNCCSSTALPVLSDFTRHTYAQPPMLQPQIFWFSLIFLLWSSHLKKKNLPQDVMHCTLFLQAGMRLPKELVNYSVRALSPVKNLKLCQG